MRPKVAPCRGPRGGVLGAPSLGNKSHLMGATNVFSDLRVSSPRGCPTYLPPPPRLLPPPSSSPILISLVPISRRPPLPPAPPP